MRTVVLIQPKLGFIDNLFGKPALPLALLHLSSFLSGNYRIVILDQRIEGDFYRKLNSFIFDDSVICFGITSYPGENLHYCLQIIQFIKSKSTKIPVVFGGTIASLATELALNSYPIDFILKGNAELSFYNLVVALDQGKDFSNISNLCFRSTGGVLINSWSNQDYVTTLPGLPYYVLNPNHYNVNIYNFQSSRGCIYNCSFCFNNLFYGGRWHPFDVEDVVRRAQEFISWAKPKHICFIDENFLVDTRRAVDILERVSKINYGITFSAATDLEKINTMTQEELALFYSLGLRTLNIGVESGSDRILKMVNKKVDLHKLLGINSKLKCAGIVADYFFMIGFPHENIDDLRLTCKLAVRLKEENPLCVSGPFLTFTYMPGMGLEELINKTGHAIPAKLDDYVSYDFFNIFNNDIVLLNKVRPWLSKPRCRLIQSIQLSSLSLRVKNLNKRRGFFYIFFKHILIPFELFRLRRFIFIFMFEKIVLHLLSVSILRNKDYLNDFNLARQIDRS